VEEGMARIEGGFRALELAPLDSSAPIGLEPIDLPAVDGAASAPVELVGPTPPAPPAPIAP